MISGTSVFLCSQRAMIRFFRNPLPKPFFHSQRRNLPPVRNGVFRSTNPRDREMRAASCEGRPQLNRGALRSRLGGASPLKNKGGDCFHNLNLNLGATRLQALRFSFANSHRTKR